MKVSRIDAPESLAAETDLTGPHSKEAVDGRVEDQAEPAEKDAVDVQTDGTADAATADAADDTAGSKTEEAADDTSEAETGDRASEKPAKAKSVRAPRSISVRSLVIAAVMAILAGAVGTMAWLYVGAQDKLDAQANQSDHNARAEKMALDYAVNAATMGFKDLQAWKVKLVAGTSPELNNKLTEAAKSMEQILVPLEWSSTAQPLVAKVRSNADGVFVVNCFVSVQTKTVQAPEPLQSTATYSVTIDSNKDWQITDVGGIGSVVGAK